MTRKETPMQRISDKAILNIMKANFQGSGIRDDGSFTEYTGTPEKFLSLARICFDQGYIEGMWECQQVFMKNREN